MRNVKPFPTAKTGLESKILISSLAVSATPGYLSHNAIENSIKPGQTLLLILTL